MKQQFDFNITMDHYKNTKKSNKGRPKGSAKRNVVLLEYRTWIIEVDNSFPSINYIVRKKSDTQCHHVAYCGSLESALKLVFDQMLLDTVNRRNNYGERFNDLKNVILETKNEISRLLDVSPILKNKIKKGEIENEPG